MYKWKFFKSARCVQVKLENGEDLAALKELDQKLWTVLAASTDGLRFDPATLKLLDSDGDGRIRVPEVRAAVEWMRVRFKKLDFLFAYRVDAYFFGNCNVKAYCVALTVDTFLFDLEVAYGAGNEVQIVYKDRGREDKG